MPMNVERPHSLSLALALPVALVALGCGRFSNPANPVNAIPVTTHSIEVLIPCAERVIVRNRDNAARRLQFIVGRTRADGEIRGRESNPRLPFFSLIRALPDGGAAGRVVYANGESRFDSRGVPSCFPAIPDSAPPMPPDDYWFSNSQREQTGVGFFPGLVVMSFKDSITTAAHESLLRELRGSVVAMAPARFPGQDYIVWFDGDDETAAIAKARAAELSRSSLVRTASPMTFGGIWGSPPD